MTVFPSPILSRDSDRGSRWLIRVDKVGTVRLTIGVASRRDVEVEVKDALRVPPAKLCLLLAADHSI